MIRFRPSVFSAALRLLVPAALLLSGCATSSVWTPYPAQTGPLIRQLERGGAVDADTVFGRRVLGRDRVLYRMEQGRLAQVQHNIPTSQAAYADAIQATREMDERAIISATRTAGKGAALMINDNAIPYEADGYERVMLHHEQALNYLLSGDLEGAGVEVRVAAAEQAEALRRRARELDKAREQERYRGSAGSRQGDLAAVNARLEAAAGRVKNSFQNAYTFYMSAVVRELLDDPNGAYIDYRKAAEIMPENPTVRADVLRLAEDLGMARDAADYHALWPDASANRVPAGQGEVIVLFEDGFLPPRSEFSLPVPLFSGGFTAIALPVYTGPWGSPAPVKMDLTGSPGGESALICDLNALSAKALQERMPAILARQVVRATAKAMAPQLAQSGRDRDVLVLIMSLYSLVTERADLRSWNTLPQSAQVMRAPCQPGRQVLTLTHRGTGARAVCNVDVRPGGRTLVVAIRTGGRLSATSVTF
jgi:hypothetical protein